MDFDIAVIGSGFGGSVAALRLTQKGYRVVVVEAGRRWSREAFPTSSNDLRRWLWQPELGMRGIQQLHLLRHALVLSGAGVGGGSLLYGNTLFWPMRSFFDAAAVQRLGGYEGLRPWYELALKMMGAVPNPRLQAPDELLRQTAEGLGRGETFTASPVGVWFGEEGREVADPYFLGEGPARTGCTACGACFTGCRVGAKNSLDRNYLYLAERLGAHVMPETRVTAVRPLDEDGGRGYRLDLRPTVGRAPARALEVGGVVVAAGVMGTLELLLRCRDDGLLPRLSDRLGRQVRTNSESIVGVRASDPATDFSRGLAASSSVFPDDHTQVQADRYGEGSNAMSLLSTVMVDGGGTLPRPLRFLGHALRRPGELVRAMTPGGFARQTMILVVMQDADSHLRVTRRRRWLWPTAWTLASHHDDGPQAPDWLPAANAFARALAERVGGIPLSSVTEVLLGVPVTAHVLGGCLMAPSPSEGVIDDQQRAFGYQNLWICDGSVIPANLGANPALSILAFAERAMARVPRRPGTTWRPLAVDRAWGVEEMLRGERH